MRIDGFVSEQLVKAIFLQLSACQKVSTPYNAPPSTGQAATQTSQSVPRKAFENKA
jgi:hypothetical protein